MKYLKLELYEKVCSVGGEAYEEEWNEQYQSYLNELERISSRLPKYFLKEYYKTNMHDNIIKHIFINKIDLRLGCRYDLNISLIDYHDKRIEHVLIFTDFKNLKSELSFGSFAGNCDWIYSEILPLNEKRLSFEVLLFSDSILYFEFSKLHYKKIITQ